MTMAYSDFNDNSNSSSSDEALISFRNKTNNVTDNYYSNLIRPIKQNCDICDKVFTDRYSAIVHNNSHIIIPLIKISVVQCNKCYKLEPTKEDLYLHMILEHRDVKLEEKIKNKIIFEEDIVDVKVKVEDDDDDDDDINNDIDDIDYDVKSDINDDDVLSVVDVTDEEENNFRNLIKFGLHKCKYCNDIYSNKYKLLQHNIEHIMINTRSEYLCGHCERFFESDFDLDRHTVIEHNGVMIKIMQFCYSCNLPYSDLLKHYKFYHVPPPSMEETVRCRSCNIDVSKSDVRKHVIDHQDTLHVCDICKLFLKDSNAIKYSNAGVHSREGKRSKCHKCGNKFFDLHIVKRVRNNHFIKSPRPYKKKSFFNYKINNKYVKKPLSNMDRLKNIQQRLKIIKHLNKF